MARVLEPFVPDLLAACALGRGHRFLDVGTGTGLVAAAAAATPGAAVRVVGLDVSPAMLARARERVAPLGVALVTGDAEALPCRDGSFDAAAGHFVLVFLDRPAAALAELRRVLRPGGRVALTALRRPEATAYGPVLEALGRRAHAAAGALAPAVLARRAWPARRAARGRRVRGDPRRAGAPRGALDVVRGVLERDRGGRRPRGPGVPGLPDPARGAVREEVERAVAARGLAWEVEALLADRATLTPERGPGLAPGARDLPRVGAGLW